MSASVAEGEAIRRMSGLSRDELCALWLWAHSMDYLGGGGGGSAEG